MIDQFSKEQFENFLENHKPYEPLGLIDGEYTYKLVLDGQSSIMLRSSIGVNGLAKKSGKDSIRLWLVGNDDKPIGSKLDSWTARVNGWQNRLSGKISELIRRRNDAGDCRKCGKPFGVFRLKEAKRILSLPLNKRVMAITEAIKERKLKYSGEMTPKAITQWLKSDEVLFVKCWPCKIKGNLNNEGWFSQASQMETFNNANISTSTKRQNEMAHFGQAESETVMQVGKNKAKLDHSDIGIVASRNKRLGRDRGSLQKLPEETTLDQFLANPFPEDEPENKPVDDFPPNTQQKLAIEKPINANVRLLAGPGTGKTFTIKHRVKQLISESVSPNNILVITYSKPMADEMGDKILSLSPDAIKEQISTIHAFCYRELARNNQELKYYGWQVPDKNAPLKTWQVKAKIEDLVSEIWPKNSKEKPGHKEVLEWINRSKYYGITHGQSPEWFVSYLGSFFGLNLAKIRVSFDKWLYSHHCLTFADMLYLMEQEMIGNPDFKAKMQAKYSHVIVDEGQDTNYQAFRILYHLFENGTKLFLVADVNQMMYRFQGAKPEYVTDEIDKVLPGIKTVMLKTNHRSNDEIIEHYQKLITYNYSDKNGPYDQKFFQNIKGVKGLGGSVRFNMADDVFSESAQIAEEINTLYTNGYKPGDIFIGARTKAQLGYLEGELLKAGIKFINIAGGSFWDSKDVKNVISYLRLAHNTQDKEAFERVHNIASSEHVYPHWIKDKSGSHCPTRFLGKKFLAAIQSNYENADTVYRAGKYGWKQRTYQDMTDGQEDLLYFVDTLISQTVTSENVGQSVQWIIDNCYEQYLKTTEGVDTEDENSKMDNLTTVIDIASQYAKVEDFLTYVDEMIQAAKDTKDKNWDDYTVIATYHRLKGLERKIIFGMGWCEGINAKTKQPVGLLPHTFSLVDPPQFGVLPAGAKSPIEDERCIGFVCVSRAMEMVYLSGCAEYRGNEMWASRFIKDMGLNNDN